VFLGIPTPSGPRLIPAGRAPAPADSKKGVWGMKIYQIRHARGKMLDEFHEGSSFEKADDFVVEKRAQEIIASHTHSEEEPSTLLPYIKWPTAKILRTEDVDVEQAASYIEDAPDYRVMGAFERAAVCAVAYPKSPAQGCPRTKVTVLLDGEPCNVTFKIAPARDVYEWPCWALT